MRPTVFELAAILLALTAGVGWFNARVLRLPSTVAMVGVGLAGALGILAVRQIAPGWRVPERAISLIVGVDFGHVLMGSMLAYLLFAGAFHTNLRDLRQRPVSVLLLATLGVLVSTALVALGLWACARLVGVPLSFAWALVFGALISPTDPVAVLSVLDRQGAPAALKGLMQGESLFNDGIGVVVFTGALTFAHGTATSPGELIGHVALQALGGAALGGVLGGLVFMMMRAIDEQSVETGLSVALATGAYALAGRLGVSGPIAVVIAGLLTGNTGMRFAMSERTQRYVRGFWTLVDDNLNALLFLLLGLEVVVVRGTPLAAWALGGLAIVLVIAARAVSIAPTAVRLILTSGMAPREAVVLVWGGLRGGISIALALSVGRTPERDLLLTCTYAVVLFSVLVQGLTFSKTLDWAVERPPE